MKKILSLLMTAALLVTMSVTSFAAPSYGSEWDGYYQTAPTTFTDVTSSHWAYNSIMQVYQKNWFGGYPDGSFRPNASITREEAIKVFVMFLGLDYQSVDLSDLTYSDVKASDWSAPYIEAGKDLFPVHTTIQGKIPFNPKMPVTREDTIYALVKALGCDVDVKYPDQSVLNMFSDANSISGNIKGIFSIALMRDHQLVSGFPDGTIRAQAALTRAEFATLLLRGTEHGFHDKYTAKIQSVAVTPTTSVEMTVGETINLSARATYTDGTNQAYNSLSPYDANGNGVVSLKNTTITALKEGTAVIKYNDSYLKNETLTIVVKKPTDAPTLKITDYDDVTDAATAVVKGNVTDKNGSVELTYNGRDAMVESNGSFTVKVSLNVGTNDIKFVAKNIYGVETTKSITIIREAAKEEEKTPSNNNNDNNDDNNKGNSTSTPSVDYEDEPLEYLSFDKSTGTITDCGKSASVLDIPKVYNGINIYHVGDSAFEDCTYLEEIYLPSSIKSIGEYAFSNCINLYEIVIPANVKTVGASAFEKCKSLTDVIFEGEVKVISSGMFVNCSRLKNVSLPETLKVIEDNAFTKCTSIQSIEIPEGTTTIEDFAFADCGALAEIIIPASVSDFGDEVFKGCNSLKVYAPLNSAAIDYAEANGIAWEIIED